MFSMLKAKPGFAKETRAATRGSVSRSGSTFGSGDQSLRKSSELNLAAFERRLAGLPSKSREMCAQGVRESLFALFGANPPRTSDGDFPDAHEYNEHFMKNWRTSSPNQCFRKTAASGGRPKDLDIRVMHSGQGPGALGKYGHIEVFYKGRWYSDFNQGGSLTTGRNVRYSTYRFGSCGALASR